MEASEPLDFVQKAVRVQAKHEKKIIGSLSAASPHRKVRLMRQEWVLKIKRQCDEQRPALFFKQWGGWGVDGKKRAKKQNGRLLQGRTWDAVPALTANVQIQSLTW